MAILGGIAVPHPPLIVPAVGRGEERKISATITAYKQAVHELMALAPDCIVVTSPHAPMFRDAFHVTTDETLHGSMDRFRAFDERMSVSCDVPLAEEIVRRANEAGIACVGSDWARDSMDHGTYVPLYFVREDWKLSNPDAQSDVPCPIIRIGLSGLSPSVHREMGHVVAQAAEALGRRVAFIASGDLSHKLTVDGPYGFAPEGPVFDEQIGQVFASGSLEGLFGFDEEFCEAAAECGLRSFQIMAGALDGLGLESRLLSNEGPFGVGYGVATCVPSDGNDASADVAGDGSSEAGNAEVEIDPHIALARLSVETYVRTGSPAAVPADVPAELLENRAGVFVSLHEHGELRGCIGTIMATCGCIAEEIIQNGISACSRDPRFPAVREGELDYLEYSVDVLGAAEPIDSAEQLDPKRYGVIVEKGFKRGLLLPNLDGIDTVEVQLEIAKRKAGISPADDRVDLSRFEVVRHTAGGAPRKQA